MQQLVPVISRETLLSSEETAAHTAAWKFKCQDVPPWVSYFFHSSPLTQWQYLHSPSIPSERPFEHFKKINLEIHYKILVDFGISLCWEKFYFRNKEFHLQFKVFNFLLKGIMHPKHIWVSCIRTCQKRPALWYDTLVRRGAVCGQAKPSYRQMKKTSAKPEVSFWME